MYFLPNDQNSSWAEINVDSRPQFIYMIWNWFQLVLNARVNNFKQCMVLKPNFIKDSRSNFYCQHVFQKERTHDSPIISLMTKLSVLGVYTDPFARLARTILLYKHLNHTLANQNKRSFIKQRNQSF